MRVGIWELLLLPIVALYLAPTVVAWARQKRNKAAITVLNIVGCGSSSTNLAVTPIIGGSGTSPIPVRLITPP